MENPGKEQGFRQAEGMSEGLGQGEGLVAPPRGLGRLVEMPQL